MFKRLKKDDLTIALSNSSIVQNLVRNNKTKHR